MSPTFWLCWLSGMSWCNPGVRCRKSPGRECPRSGLKRWEQVVIMLYVEQSTVTKAAAKGTLFSTYDFGSGLVNTHALEFDVNVGDREWA